jgi:hypothetical protein
MSQPCKPLPTGLSPAIILKRGGYWTLILGPKFSKKERGQMNLSRFYAIPQIEYCRNFIFKRHFPIHKIFERSCEIGLWRLTANRISEIFVIRLNKRLRGKLATKSSIRWSTANHVFRAYWKTPSSSSTVNFAFLQRLALPVSIGAVRYPGIKIPDTGIIRLLEMLLNGGKTVGGWTAKQIHQAVLTSFQLSATAYGLNQRRYDLRKLKGHGPLERDGSHYAYQLTPKGLQVAPLFLFFTSDSVAPWPTAFPSQTRSGASP